jgi:hypothetical protein
MSKERGIEEAARNRTPVQTMDVDSLTDGKEELSAYRISEENPFTTGTKILL